MNESEITQERCRLKRMIYEKDGQNIQEDKRYNKSITRLDFTRVVGNQHGGSDH